MIGNWKRSGRGKKGEVGANILSTNSLQKGRGCLVASVIVTVDVIGRVKMFGGGPAGFIYKWARAMGDALSS